MISWWRHQMETFSALLALCAGNSPVPVNSPHKGQWRGALVFSLIFAWINDWINNREAGDLTRHRGHYDVNVMLSRPLRQHPPTHSNCSHIQWLIARRKLTLQKFVYKTGHFLAVSSTVIYSCPFQHVPHCQDPHSPMPNTTETK